MFALCIIFGIIKNLQSYKTTMYLINKNKLGSSIYNLTNNQYGPFSRVKAVLVVFLFAFLLKQ